ncbi:MAG: hypothetical protein JWM41_4377 [Gemmatimonadetes bacterium]|nr:hypothetical protein [Gemmatimonadota bacterium]
MTSAPSPVARDTARRLLAREVAGAGEPESAGLAMQALCTRITENLRRSVGDDGYNALLVRVLGPTDEADPVLLALRSSHAVGSLDAVVAGVASHGVPTVTAALEALLARLLDVLGSLVGPDMALSLLDLDGPPSSASSNGQRP